MSILVFDKPGRQTFNPKQFERAKWYKGKSCNQYDHIPFTPQTSIPQRWQEYLECRECKWSIVEAVGLSFLQKGQLFVMGCQNLVIAGCLSREGENNAWVIHSSEVIGTTACDFVSYFESQKQQFWTSSFSTLNSYVDLTCLDAYKSHTSTQQREWFLILHSVLRYLLLQEASAGIYHFV